MNKFCKWRNIANVDGFIQVRRPRGMNEWFDKYENNVNYLIFLS